MFEHFTKIIFIAITAMTLLIAGIAVYSFAVNTANKIDEGIVVDKNYRAEYYTTTFYHTSNNVSVPINRRHLASYNFTIEGEKNGETVKYTFEVTETEYNNYNIGDYYKK